MGRPTRVQTVGVPLHVTQRGHWREPVFIDSFDFRLFIDSLAIASRKVPVAIHSFCLMSNHIHLLVTPYSGLAISRLFQSINARFGIQLKRRRKKAGAIWADRYRSRSIGSDQDLLHCMRYIDLNPVTARVVDHPERYPWSSYAHYAGFAQHDWIKPHPAYQSLGDDQQSCFEAYRQLMPDSLADGYLTDGNYCFQKDPKVADIRCARSKNPLA